TTSPSSATSSCKSSIGARSSDVEAHVEDVAVLDDVGLALEPLPAGARRLSVASGLDEVVPAHDLAADEASRDIGVDRRRRVDRGAAPPERPRARLLLARGEERDHVEGLREAPNDRREGRLAAGAELRRLLVRHLRELGLELQVDPGRAVHDRQERLPRQRLELGRELVPPIGERLPRVEVREQPLQLLRLLLQLRVPGFRLLGDALETTLDVVAVGDEQLELQRLEIVLRDARAREAVENDEERVYLAQLPEQLRPGTAHLDDPDRGRRDLA